MKHCNICNNEILEEEYYSDTECDYHNGCWDSYFFNEVISHGIPRSVVEGKTKLTDHFSIEYIDFKCNKKVDKNDN